ncbi:MAG: adenylate/guanylate cyclase domain-containing protein [Verrucomicrobiales bacterium]|nr:adenylate/guanylate cyclase domain-containing protein [Verrucomicrobiales bacterium]
MKSRLPFLLPCLIAALVIAWVGGFVLAQRALAPWGLDVLERMELAAFDWRVRLARSHAAPLATNLTAVYIDEDSLEHLAGETLGGYQWPFPRSVHGRVVHELKAQGAAAVGVDLFFWEPERDYRENRVDGLASDAFFARELAAAGNVVLGTSALDVQEGRIDLKPVLPELATNAWAVGHDGVRGWSPANRGVFRKVPAFVEDPVSRRRVWHLGLEMAARALGIELDRAVIGPREIRLTTRDGDERVVPLDADGGLYIDWTVRLPGRNNRQPVQHERFSTLFAASLAREAGQPFPASEANRVVLLGFSAQGQSANDWGPTAVGERTPLFLSHLCVANSLLTGRFIRRSGMAYELLLVVILGGVGAVLGWRLRAVWGALSVAAVVVAHLGVAGWAYVTHRYWLPVAAPLVGAVGMNYICLLTFRAVVERREARRVRHAFGRLVSPNVFQLLLRDAAATASVQRPVTVYFGDVRGFTRFIEEGNARAVGTIRREGLAEEAARNLLERQARETLETLNLYLGRTADLVKHHDGTLDKYIGDCVMAFWGAPVPARSHALAAVRAAMAIHASIDAMNREREAANARRRQLSGDHGVEASLLPVLRIGSTLNTGEATAGFMGSAAHISNYTVIGREVNIASRLQNHCGPGQILATEATRRQVQESDPVLAATFRSLGPLNLPDIPEPVLVYEIPWRTTPSTVPSTGAGS